MVFGGEASLFSGQLVNSRSFIRINPEALVPSCPSSANNPKRRVAIAQAAFRRGLIPRNSLGYRKTPRIAPWSYEWRCYQKVRTSRTRPKSCSLVCHRVQCCAARSNQSHPFGMLGLRPDAAVGWPGRFPCSRTFQ